MPNWVPALRVSLDRLEAAWLADQSVAQHDDFCAAIIQDVPSLDGFMDALLQGRDPRFLAALLLRGVSRLWTAGPNVHPQPV